MRVRPDALVIDAMRHMGMLSAEPPDTAGKCPCCDRAGELIDGLMACGECGEVLARHLDASPDWTRDGTMRLERCGAPVSELYPCGNGAYMVAKNAAARRVVRMQTWGNVSYAKRSMCKALSTLSSEAHHMGLCESITTRAKHMYNEVAKAPHMHGTRRAGLVQGCIYAALQTEGGARSLSEMPQVDHLAFGVKQVMRVIPVRPADPCTTRAYVARRLDALRECGPGADAALVAAGILDGLGIGNRATPPTKAAACALMTMPDADAQAVCEVMGCSRGAASRCVFRLKDYRDDLVRAATASYQCSSSCGS